MILVFVIALFFTIVTCDSVEEVPRKLTPRITGTGYSEIQRVPFQAQLIRDDVNLFCGATIIQRQWLLSASHCFVDANIDNIKVLTGSTFRINGHESSIDKVFLHPKFDFQTLDHDICLIKLKAPLVFTAKQKVATLLKTDLIPGQMIQISGYGRESDFSSHSPLLKVANVPIVDIEECRYKYSRVNDTITNSMFCAGNGLADACIGDSGGPAVSDGFLVGVISAGRFCQSKDFPGVYTRLDVHWEWIKEIFRSNLETYEMQPSGTVSSSTYQMKMPSSTVYEQDIPDSVYSVQEIPQKITDFFISPPPIPIDGRRIIGIHRFKPDTPISAYSTSIYFKK